jgi:arsenate reductase|tara:strand:+ start:433 stop:606 length:174 start_codon:yes stop_codon:yes gene_type:complete
MVRTGEQEFKDNNLTNANDDALVAAISEHPILLQRPIVVSGDRAAIGRPPESVLDIL